MANEIQAARLKVKQKLDIADAVTTFDTIIDDALTQAIPRLAPYLQYQLAEDVTVTLAGGVDNFTMPVAASNLERVYVRSSSSDQWRLIDLWQQVRNKVYLNETFGSAMEVKVIAHRPFTQSDADYALLASDYPAAMLPLYLFACSEFASVLVGNKRKFNIYQQSNGSRSLDEMKDLVEFYENRAVRILEDEISAEGQ